MADFSDLTYALAGMDRKNDPLAQRRQFAYDLLKQGTDASPIQSGWQGAARLAQAMVGGLLAKETDNEEKRTGDELANKMAGIEGIEDPQKRVAAYSAINPKLGMQIGGQIAVEQAKLKMQQDLLKQGAASFGSGYGQPGGMPPGGVSAPGDYDGRVRGIESRGGQMIYNEQGSGAYGPYQFMPETWGAVRAAAPQLGLPEDMTRASPQHHAAAFQAFTAMNARALQQAGAQPTPGNLYLAHRFGPKGALAVLAADPNTPLEQVLPPDWQRQNPDMRGQTAGGFRRLAAERMQGVGVPQPGATPAPQGAPSPLAGAPQPTPTPPPGGPPAPTPQGVTGPTVTAGAPPATGPAPTVPNIPRPAPTPQQLQQYQRRMLSGEFGFGADATSRARAALDAEIDRQWTVDRDVANKGYEQQLEAFKYGRKRTDDQPQETIGNEKQLREQFDQLQPVKDYRKAATVFRSAVDAANTNSAAADLNLVYSFATLMDPGSVVREGEMGMVRATQTASDQVKALVAMVTGGQRLSPEARRNLVDQMSVRYDAYKGVHDQLADAFGGIAERGGMKRDNVVVPLAPLSWQRRTDNQNGLDPANKAGGEVYDLDGKPIKKGPGK